MKPTCAANRFAAWAAAAGISCVLCLPALAQIIQRIDTRPSGLSATSNLSRERDAYYLEDFTSKPLKLKVTKDVVVYNNLTAQRRVGIIPAGRTVTVVALSEKAFRVRGKAEHDDVSGWVGKTSLESLDPKIEENINKMIERQALVDELIKKREIALGMTPTEVERVLGPPSKRSSRIDKSGRVEIYDYITYKQVPQQSLQRDQYGRLYYATVYVKVESGRRSVTFENDVVSSIEENTGAPAGGAPRMVPLPIEIDLMR